MTSTPLAKSVLVFAAAALFSAPALAQSDDADSPQADQQAPQIEQEPTASSETAQASGPLRFQLNNAQTADNACELTFVVQNETGTEISQSSYSMTVVNTEGRVTTLITFEFGPFPQDRPKVQQFALADTQCEDLSAISINEYGECVTGDGDADTVSVCEEAIRPASLTDIEFPWSF